MKKLFIIFLILLWAGIVWAGEMKGVIGIQKHHLALLARKGTSSGVDYTADANCMGAWYLNEDGTTAEPDRCTAGTEDLAVSGGGLPTSATVPSGYSGASRDFETDDTDYLWIADSNNTDISGHTGLTICAWFDLETTGTDGMLIFKGGASNNQYWLVYESGTTSIEFTVTANGSSSVKATGSDDVSSGWHHACGVHDPDTDLLYVYTDGVEDDTTAHSGGIYDGNSIFRIGAGNSVPFDGLIDEVLVRNIASTAGQILGIYNNGIDGDKGTND